MKRKKKKKRPYAGLKTYELTPDYMNEISCKEGPFNNKPFLYIISLHFSASRVSACWWLSLHIILLLLEWRFC